MENVSNENKLESKTPSLRHLLYRNYEEAYERFGPDWEFIRVRLASESSYIK